MVERPRYDGDSIVNLMASIISADGGESLYPCLNDLDIEKLRSARNILLLVVDGLGYEFLCSCSAGAFMRRHLKRSITSVFPPTTATAITTFLTGLAPQQHGLTGWFVYFRELGSVVRVLPFTTRLGSIPLEAMGVRARELFGHVAVFDRLTRAAFSVSPARIAYSEFNQSHGGCAKIKPYGTLEEFFLSIEDIVKRTEEQSFVYGYWAGLDHLAHLEGIGSEAARNHLRELDAGLERLLEGIKGTDSMLILTADHGFVDIASDKILNLADHPDLSDTLSLPLCGEPRAAYCYVWPGRTADFLSYVETEFSTYADCVPSEDLVAEGYFGPGVAHPRLLERVGQYTLLMRDEYAIQDDLPSEERFTPVGLHGGGSSAELYVPLIVAEA